MKMNDHITLNIPAKAAYLLTARLTASSIGARMGFNVEDIEDIKTATAEACLILIHAGKSSDIDIEFEVNEKQLKVNTVSIPGQSPNSEPINEDGTLGQYLLEALTDDVQVHSEKDCIKGVTFIKKLVG